MLSRVWLFIWSFDYCYSYWRHPSAQKLIINYLASAKGGLIFGNDDEGHQIKEYGFLKDLFRPSWCFLVYGMIGRRARNLRTAPPSFSARLDWCEAKVSLSVLAAPTNCNVWSLTAESQGSTIKIWWWVGKKISLHVWTGAKESPRSMGL